ncbi:MAG TPA: hypothetical protein VFH98_10175 [Candidatus Limnocylindria bacterium]|nr:hypothetical protein [Candidatus Limnocylindria bacterium]
MRAADNAYLNRIAEDCRTVLGPGVTVLGVQRVDLESAVRLSVHFELLGAQRETSAVGPTVVAAHAALRQELVRARLEAGFGALIRDQ